MRSFPSSLRFWLLAGCGTFLTTPLVAQDDGPGGPPPWMQQNGQQGGNQGGPETQQGGGGQGQRPQMGGGGGAAIAVDEGSVYVVTSGQLLKYDQKTLQLQSSAMLMSRQGQGQGSGQSGPNSQGGQGGQGGPMMGGMGGGTAISVKEGSVYVVTNGKLMKFDAQSLDLEGSVELQKKSPPNLQSKKKKGGKESDSSGEKPGEPL